MAGNHSAVTCPKFSAHAVYECDNSAVSACTFLKYRTRIIQNNH